MTNYTYDGNGNLTTGGGLSFTYNAQNQTTAINTDTYNYTGADQTDRVTVNSSNYTYGALGLGSASNGSANTYYTRDNNGRLVSERTSTGTYYYSLNSLGSVSVLTDSSGNVKNTYAYDPWGNSLGKTEAVSNPWQFAGGFYDATTGLYKFGTRYYSPTLGRWTQQDPVGGSIGKAGSGDAYVYADDAPVMMTDPSGRDAVGCFFSWIVSIADVISVIGTLVWFDPIAAAGIELLDAIPIVGIILSITGAVALIAFNVWAVEGTLYFDYQLIKSNCS